MACFMTNLLKSSTNLLNKSYIRHCTTKGVPSGKFPCNIDILKPTSSLGGTGAVFTTKIKRKREIADPNKPKFITNEPLRWSAWSMLSDVRKRHIAQQYYPEKTLLTCVSECKLLPTVLRDEAKQQITELPKCMNFSYLHHGKTKIKNRCVISSRGHGKLKRYRISRHFWRHLADYNLLSGVAKAHWG